VCIRAVIMWLEGHILLGSAVLGSDGMFYSSGRHVLYAYC
jgi:hypothetical protein